MSQKVPLLIFHGIFFLSSFLLFIGVLLNGNNLKYKKFSSSSCQKGLFITTLSNSEFCCQSFYYSSDWACIAAYDSINSTFSSVFAWSIPIIPFILTMFMDILAGYFKKTQKTHLRRLLFYVFIFIYRTVRLFFLLLSLALTRSLSFIIDCFIYYWWID